ncbi:MAG: DUF1634 domain-containing protein [Bacteroidota bacterium]
MFFKAALLVILGILCLITAIVALVLGIIAFANSKQNKYVWLVTFLCSITGMIICIFIFVTKVVHTVQTLAKNAIGQFEHFGDSLSHMESIDTHQANSTSLQIELLKSYLPTHIINKAPEAFYTYLGFKDYYRYPLRYPYSIHYMDSKDNGELYNESNVNRFDENDNGEIYTGLSNITKIAFDKNYLLAEQSVTSTRTDKLINHYILFNFETEKKEEVASLSKLLQLAKSKNYSGPDTLMTLEQYHRLF